MFTQCDLPNYRSTGSKDKPRGRDTQRNFPMHLSQSCKLPVSKRKFSRVTYDDSKVRSVKTPSLPPFFFVPFGSWHMRYLPLSRDDQPKLAALTNITQGQSPDDARAAGFASFPK
jgi:hypothetical protein